jgi:hypothetical protein
MKIGIYTFIESPITICYYKKNDGFKMEDIFVKKMMFLESKSLLKCVLLSLINDYEFVIVLFKNKMVDTKWRTFF